MQTVSTYNIVIEHKEPNSIYPNSKEVYEISIPDLDWKESFSIRTGAPKSDLDQDIKFFINRATNRILGIPNKELEL